jgi:hypothetical protein
VTPPLLTNLADVARLSGLTVVELDGWEHNYSNGDFDPDGTLCHHTGSFDGLTDATDDLSYAKWLAFTGRPDLPPPLCNLALSAECVVYVCAAGNANHAGYAQSSGPMPSASDGSALYIGIEAMNSGTQGWGSIGHTAAGEEITQGEAYALLCAALAVGYGWPADHTRAHRETSVTGKWDPGGLDMDTFRAAVARAINTLEDPMAGITLDQIEERVRKVVVAELEEHDQEVKALVRKLFTNQRVILKERFQVTDVELDELLGKVDELVARASRKPTDE